MPHLQRKSTLKNLGPWFVQTYSVRLDLEARHVQWCSLAPIGFYCYFPCSFLSVALYQHEKQIYQKDAIKASFYVYSKPDHSF